MCPQGAREVVADLSGTVIIERQEVIILAPNKGDNFRLYSIKPVSQARQPVWRRNEESLTGDQYSVLRILVDGLA
ncbi:hypothetical protein A3731_40655 [Roseovarius sp. HI0049]|nr:hypothetical protein A3731_40655 [Roseovarius sp. HI0049]